MATPRSNHVAVRLSDQELTRLDELRGDQGRAEFFRALLREPPREDEVATRSEALAILTRQARDGRVSSAIALARELRDEHEAPAGALGKLLARD